MTLEQTAAAHATTRRTFLKGAGAVTLATVANGAVQLGPLGAVFGGAPGGNVVVLLSLRGGADGLAALVPRGTDHDRLVSLRPTLAIPEAALVAGTRRFGLHPAFAPLAPMWTDRRFAAVHAVGLPSPNLSHFEATTIMELAGGTSGWLNRLIAALPGTEPEDMVHLGSALTEIMARGPAPTLATLALSSLTLANLGAGQDAMRESLTTMWQSDSGPTGASIRAAVDVTRRLSTVSTTPAPVAGFPPGQLQVPLAEAAALVKADLGVQLITIDHGHWDTHVASGTVDSGPMASQISHLAGSLKAFFDALGDAAARVTVVTVSEFGRRVAENGCHGTDHGYGTAMLLLGAGVRGGTVHGRWPGLDRLDAGNLAVRQDYRSVLWEVIKARFPEVSGQLGAVFPGFTPDALGTML